MSNIKQIISSFVNETSQNLPEKIIYVLDNSGSTGNLFSHPNINVLEKEMDTLMQNVLKNRASQQYLYSFHSDFRNHGLLTVMEGEDFVNLPNLRPEGSTYTHLPLEDVLNNYNRIKPTRIVIYTDGETNSSRQQIITVVDKLKKNGIRIDVIATSFLEYDLDNISRNEENKIPGMDLVNMLGNKISSLQVYNKRYKDIPFEGIQNSSIDKNSLKLMNVSLPRGTIIPKFINSLVTHLSSQISIDWGLKNNDFRKLCSDIGVLLSAIFVKFPDSNYFIYETASILHNLCPEFTTERIESYFKYGFKCCKEDKPIFFTNFEEKVKESSVKKEEFKDAVDQLKMYGTTLNSNRSICLPINGYCIIDTDGSIEKPFGLGLYPKSKDSNQNVYFGCDVSPQAIRIAIRELYNDRNSPNIIFRILSLMSLMYLKDVPFDSEYMVELRKLAIIQTSMEVVVAKGKYDGQGCYLQWKAGKSPAINYQKSDTHTSLFRDKNINPLALNEPTWWALMMALLDIFEEQKFVYNTTLQLLSIESNRDAFLNYIKTTYSSYVEGTVNLFKNEAIPNSIITLCPFVREDITYVLKDHGECKSKTIYTEDQLDYIKFNGCVWCHHKPMHNEFERINLCFDNFATLLELSRSSTALTVKKTDEIAELSSSMQNVNLNSSNNKQIKINMIGITGSGKSTASEIIYRKVLERGGACLIVSADKWSKIGKKPGNMISNELKKFKNVRNSLKVIVMDLCNENGADSNAFGYDFSDYVNIDFYPNFNRDMFVDYEYWCLTNVLNREIHTPESNYWLNVVSAGLNTVLMVHAKKRDGIKRLLNIRTQSSNFSGNKEEIILSMKDSVERYSEYLKTRSLENEVEGLLM